MLYAAEQLILSNYTVALVNAQITALNTALGVAATAVAVRSNWLLRAGREAEGFPALLYGVGIDPARSELPRFGKRDTLVPVRLAIVSRHTEPTDGRVDVQVGIEALCTIMDGLPGQQHAATKRFCVEVLDPVVEFVPFKLDEQVIRQGGELRFAMLMRTET